MSSESAVVPDTNNTAPSLLTDNVKVAQNQQTVEFNEDGKMAEAIIQPLSIDETYIHGAQDDLQNTIIDIFARPIIMNEFEWTSADLVFTDLLPAVPYPNVWMNKTMIKSKLEGFRYFRGDLVLRLQVNAQPFNAGILMLFFNPFGNQLTEQPSSLTHFGGVSGYRHVTMNIAEVTSVEMRIPFMCPLSHYDLITQSGDMGTVLCKVYSQLTGEASVDGALWAHYENVSLEMPTGMPIFTAQSGGEKKAGDVETLLKTTGRISKRFNDVPILGEFSKTVSWAADAAAQVAGIFGWSKPTDPEFETAVNVTYVRNMANFNGKSLSKPLGLDARNAVETPTNVFGTEEDEMAISTITSRWIYLDRFDMTDASAPGTQLWAWPVHPSSCKKYINSGNVTNHHTFLSYLSQTFEFWRGGLCYKFLVAKTPFHSGRIRIIFAPGALLSTPLTSINRDFCYSKIVDLRDTTEFSFSVPFVSNALWNATHKVNADQPDAQCYETPTGMIYIEVLNKLRNPDTAASSIEFVVETCADEDFQFAFYTRKQIESVARMTAQSRADPLFKTNAFTDAKPNRLAMGEVVTSIRQVLKRYHKISDSSITPATATEKNKVYPFVTTQNAANVKDMFSFFNEIYRCWKGGMRVMLVNDINDTAAPTRVTLEPYGLGNATFGDYFSLNSAWEMNSMNGVPQVLFFSGIENTLELDVPFYQPYPFLPTSVGKPAYAADFDGIPPNNVPYNMGSNLILENPSNLSMYRCIGEDFSFGYLLGPPRNSFPIG